MRNPDTALLAATRTSVPAGRRVNAPVELVCLALLLALVALGFRIASLW